MVERLVIFFAVLTRISAFFLILPVFGWQTLPMRFKMVLTVLLAVFFCAVAPVKIDTKGIGILQIILLLVSEATYGLALGLIVVSLFSVVKLAGVIIEREMGLSMAQVLDPLTGEEADPLSSLIEILFILLFLSADGHHILLLIISKSYAAFPVGTVPTIGVLANGIINAGSTMLIAGLRLAAPILAALLVLMVTLALLARLVPEMNILFISFPVSICVGLFMASAFLPFVNGYIAEMAEWMAKLLPLKS
jgi:flagellar biosynthesis protein FliR